MSSATKLISRLLPRSFEVTDKQEVLKQVVGLASDAAAFALGADKGPQVALELLEQGRGLLSSSFEELRIDILHLHEQYPNLAKDFLRLREQLQAPVTFEILPGLKQEYRAMAVRLNLQITASKEFDELTEQIRKLPGFEEFLAAPCPAQIKGAAQCGPIVVVNISDHRCDALLIQPYEIRAVNLPNVSKVAIEQKARARNLGSPEILEWLWDTIAGPILDTLGFTQEPSIHGDWPHMWWIPTGPLRSFPLHAAGYHAKRSSETVLDRVISSYSTSIKSLIYGRRRQLLPFSQGKALLVAMAQTPRFSPLPNATREVAVVRRLCESLGLQVAEPRPVRDDVLECLRDCKIFHFAGHGYTNIINPLLSALYLEDWNDEILSVADLLEQSLDKTSPFLAYLSACGTGQVKDEKSVDESIHLISACQLSGFRHVIGTLWSINDKHCVEMAATTYKEIVDQGISDESVCRGLHQAIRKLRDSWLRGKAKDRHQGTDWRTVGKRRGNGNYMLNTRRKRRIMNYVQRGRCNKKAARGKIRTREVFIPRILADHGAMSGEPNRRWIRDIFCVDEDDEEGPLFWVPYVHYGV
jgi:CHAT domain-containing protein